MSDLLPTPEQEEAAYATCAIEFDTGYGLVRVAQPADIALLLVEREEPLRAVICRLRACLNDTLPFLDDHSLAAASAYNDAFVALHDTEKYEVVE